MTAKVAFVGGGMMASAILASPIARDLWPAGTAVVAEPDASARERLTAAGYVVCADAAELPAAEAYFLCVKPQDLPLACASLVRSNRLVYQPVISIAAGVTTTTLAQLLGGGQFVRTMPNTPVLVGHGCTFACGPDGPNSAAAQLATTVFQGCGAYHWVEREDLIDAATALSGSGPAYAYLVIETMAATAVEMGLSPTVALEAAVATVRGACEMVSSTAELPAVLRERVTSKGGTTAAALRTLEDRGFATALATAMTAAKDRARELSDGSERTETG